MITRTITIEQYYTIEEAKTALDEATGMLAVLRNSLAGSDGTTEPEQITEAAAGIERIVRTVSGDLDRLASEILKGKLEITGEDLTPTTAQFLKA